MKNLQRLSQASNIQRYLWMQNQISCKEATSYSSTKHEYLSYIISKIQLHNWLQQFSENFFTLTSRRMHICVTVKTIEKKISREQLKVSRKNLLLLLWFDHPSILTGIFSHNQYLQNFKNAWHINVTFDGINLFLFFTYFLLFTFISIFFSELKLVLVIQVLSGFELLKESLYKSS